MMRTVSIGVAVLALLAFTASSALGQRQSAFVTNNGCRANQAPAGDEDSSDEVRLPFSVDFFGRTYKSLWVNTNGNVTFDEPLGDFTPFSLLDTTHAIIAPFFADVDTRAAGTVEYGAVGAGDGQLGGREAFCVSWRNVGYFENRADKLNSFQLVLIDRSDTGPGNFDIEVNYDKVQWESGDMSGGANGLGGDAARIGYANGSGASFELPGSGVAGDFLDSSARGLIHESKGAPQQSGRYVFAIRNGSTGGDARPACVVPNVRGKALVMAKRKVVAGHCSVGAVKRLASKTVAAGRVVSQRPGAGRTLASGAKVRLVVSRGRR
jgi:hypothetical protein